MASGKKKFSFFVSMQKVYDRVIAFCFNWPKTTIAFGIVSVIAGTWIFVSRPFQLMPIAERNQFAVEIFMPSGTSVERTTQVADSLERILSKDDRIVSIASFHGCASPRFQATYAPQVGGPNFAQFIVNTKSNEATIEVLDEYTGRYEAAFPDAFVRFKQLSYSNAAYPVEVRLTGRNMAEIEAVADTFLSVMRGVPGLRSVRSSLDNPLASVIVAPERTAASRLGLNSLILESELALRYSTGLPLATLWEGDYALPVVLKTASADTASISGLEEEPVGLTGVTSVPLRQIAGLRPEWHPGMLQHRNGIPEISLIAEVERNVNVIDRTEKLMERLDKIEIPDSVTVKRGGEWDTSMSILPQILSALAMAVAIIFFIILFHYSQIDTATLMLLCLTLSIPGAGIGMWLQGTVLSLTCVLGIVSLMGILVRNAIVLLDYAEELRNQGQSLKDAVFNASRRRMRPIFLTSAAATMGVLPMVIGNSALWQPMGVVIFYGTPITMIFILTVIPVAYWMMKSRAKDADKPLKEPLETHLI